MKPFSGFHEGMVKPPAIRREPAIWEGDEMADRNELKLVGYIYASVPMAATLAATAVVMISIP
jgi:hypothetical protein